MDQESSVSKDKAKKIIKSNNGPVRKASTDSKTKGKKKPAQ